MLMSLARIFFGEMELYQIVLTDISDQKRQEAMLNYYATTDEMTGLINRRSGLLFLKKEFENSRRYHDDLTIGFVDIDGLKRVNDQYGHKDGDWLIKTIAQAILGNIRVGDVAFRFGGDEIVMVLVNCQRLKSLVIFERIEAQLAEINRIGEKPYRLEMSYGLVQISDAEFKDYKEFLNFADQQMYQNKAVKKNRRAT